MAFIGTTPVSEATDEVRALYETFQDPPGHVPNYVRVFSPRPDLWPLWLQLIRGIRGAMDPRRYELVTVTAAMAIKSSYCSLAHGKVLCDKILGAEQTEAFVRDADQANLTPVERSLVAYARKVALQSNTVTQQDIDELRGHGLSDTEILEVAAAVSARCFFAKLLDAVGAEPDHHYAEMAPELRQVLVVGRAIESGPAT